MNSITGAIQFDVNSIYLSNYMAFDDPVVVRVRPITVLTGPNGSGKSSFINFMKRWQGAFRSRYQQTHFVKSAFAHSRNVNSEKQSTNFLVTGTSSNRIGCLKDQNGDDFIGQVVCEIKGNLPCSDDGDEYDVEMVLHAASSWLDGNMDRRMAIPANDDGFAAWESSDADHLDMASITDAYAVGGIIEAMAGRIEHMNAACDEDTRSLLMNLPGNGTVKKLDTLRYTDTYDILRPHMASVAGIDDVYTETYPNGAKIMYAKTSRNGKYVEIGDVGTGAKSSLAVMVRGITAGPMSTFAVEHPETGLHIQAQLEMGSYFAGMYRQLGIRSIIETQSDPLLLRLRRLVSDGTIAPGDITVAYFGEDEDNPGSTTVRNIDVEEDGRLSPGLPMSFFGADIIEGLKLGARTPVESNGDRRLAS